MNRLEEALSGASRAYRKQYRKFLATMHSGKGTYDNVAPLAKKSTQILKLIPKKKAREKFRSTDKGLRQRYARSEREDVRGEQGKYKKYESKDMGKLLQNLVEGTLGKMKHRRLAKKMSKMDAQGKSREATRNIVPKLKKSFGKSAFKADQKGEASDLQKYLLNKRRITQFD